MANHSRIRTAIYRLKKSITQRYKRRSYALNGLDIKLETYLDFKNGFFIEVGANDGVRQSNTLYFERYKGWNGLLIEPIPWLALKCRRNRPKCIVENCALVSNDYMGESVKMQYCGLMSIVEGAMRDSAVESLHVEKGQRFLKKGEEVIILEVPARTLNAVLYKHKIATIDLLSIDVEGYEAEVLRGIDFSRYTPRHLLIEVRSYEDVMKEIGMWYDELDILHENVSYRDILYKRR